jgi:uncharacterized repeat protein (TIGR01451 family)
MKAFFSPFVRIGRWKKAIGIVLALLIGVMLPTLALAIFDNGGFETGDFSQWTISWFQNDGLTGAPPFDGSDIQRGTGGSNQSAVLGPFSTPMSQADPETGNNLRYPRFGQYVARIEDNSSGGFANAITQTTTILTGDVDPLDGKVHVRFAYAPVLENPEHSPAQQPYVYYAVRNVDRSNALLAEKFLFAGQAGVPWSTSTSSGGDPLVYLPWQLVDIPLQSSQVAAGERIALEIIASDCEPNGHFGYIYIDAFGAFIDGLTTFAGVDLAGVAQGGQVTFVYYYRNTSGAAVDNVVLRSALPTQTSFLSAPGCSEAAGVITCSLGNLADNATGSIPMTFQVDPGASGFVDNGNYTIEGDGQAPLYGPLVSLPVVPGFTLAITPAGDGAGNVTRSPDKAVYNPGETVTLTAVPGAGATFGGWGGALSGRTNPVTFVMDGSKSITVTFILDTDEDGVPNSQERPGDTDGDGDPDVQDPDDDNDGLPTGDEDTDGDGNSANDDSDGDGAPDYLDTDSDNDGIPDSVEGSGDTDGDTLPDRTEPNQVDTDGDGRMNPNDPDDDDDLIPTADEDLDADGNLFGDDNDADSLPNFLDNDDDGDTVLTRHEDADGDGDPRNDDYPDQDGIPNYLDLNSDGDGIRDDDEAYGDADDDGVPDRLESNTEDLDGGGVPDFLDADDDGDGFPTVVEDANLDGNPVNDDTDGDGKPDFRDTDSDGDGLADKLEGWKDTDKDTVPDRLESNTADTDQDGKPNFNDPDDDGDGAPTWDEDYNDDGTSLNDDTNDNGVLDYLDPGVAILRFLFPLMPNL